MRRDSQNSFSGNFLSLFMYLSQKFTVPQMMSVSGHKTETMFYKYVKLSLDEYADSVASAAVDGLF